MPVYDSGQQVVVVVFATAAAAAAAHLREIKDSKV
jgi:hypothetical protein